MKKKILILNGSHSEIPLIKSAKKLGFYVITSGNSPELIGHKFADEYHYADYSNIQEILSLSKKLNIDAICSCANDFGLITASYVSEKLCIPSHDNYETILQLHIKDNFKDFAQKNNILTPKAKWYSVLDEAITDKTSHNYPVIIKPVDMSGGKGITKVSNYENYENAVKLAYDFSRRKKIVVEEFIEGTYHSLTTFILNKKVVFYFSDNEYSFINPYFVSTSAAPASNINIILNDLICDSEKIATLLNLQDGIFHIQYIYKDKKAYIIEITRRCSGDLYPYPVNIATGIDWAEWIVKSETGIDCSDFPFVKQQGFCGRHCIMSSKNGVVKNVIIDDSLKKNIVDSFVWWKKGDKINNFLTDKLGVLILKYNSHEEMLKKTNNINNLVKVDVINR